MSKNNKYFFEEKNTWSEIKDKLLSCYLIPYFQKILTKGNIYYIDCFAGKGKFDDGKSGSPLIALQARNDCMSRANNCLRKINMWFIDLNYERELRENTAIFETNYGLINIISGKYEEKIEGLLTNKQGANVFLYIDPYGIQALDINLFDKLNTFGFSSFEMLINFNSFGFFRNACCVMNVDCKSDLALQDLDELVEYEPIEIDRSQKSEKLLTSIAGGDYWKAIVNDYYLKKINGYQAEKRLSKEYKQRLRQRYEYVLDMPIRLKAGQRPKYRMIHVCNHEDGCFLMAQNMQKRKDELFINIQQEDQISIFDINQDILSSMENEIVTREEITEKLIEHLMKIKNDIRITRLLATFVNEYGLLCEFNMLYNILDELNKNGLIEIIRNPALTAKKAQPSTFWEESKDKSIIIRSLRK